MNKDTEISLQLTYDNRDPMPAKSLRTLAMIYATVELQNPLPRKTMLWKGDVNISASTSDTFLQR